MARLLRILVATLFGLFVLLAWTGLPLDVPYIGYGLGSAFVFQIAVRPRRSEILSVAIAGGALALFDVFTVHHGHFEDLRISTCLGLLGLVSFLVLGFRAIWAEAEERRQLKNVLIPAAALTFFILGSQQLLNLGGLIFTNTLDLYAYAFDGSLGFQPSFLLGRLFRDYQAVNLAGHFTYYLLPVPMVLVYAAHLRRRDAAPLFILELFMAAGLLGYFLYLAFPAAGPLYVAGPEFPGSPLTLSALHALQLRPVPINWTIPRNAMPSLHMTWALLVWFNCKPFSRAVRALALLFVLITVFDTLGTGEHYLIDLVVALPFAVFVQALCTNWLPLRSPLRMTPLAGGGALVLLWLAALRYGTAVFLLSPVIPWASLAISTAAALYWMSRVLSVVQAPPASATLAQVATAATP
jgi:PAP2 superfamily protein